MEEEVPEQQKRSSKPIAVSVPNDMFDWLEKYDLEHPDRKINRSKIFQDAVYLKIHPEQKKVSSQVVLMMFMNFVISMAIIFTSLMMPGNVVSQNLRLVLNFLAFALTVMSLMTYRYEKIKMKK